LLTFRELTYLIAKAEVSRNGCLKKQLIWFSTISFSKNDVISLARKHFCAIGLGLELQLELGLGLG